LRIFRGKALHLHYRLKVLKEKKMLLTTNTIHRQLLFRFFLVWVSISIIAGSISFYIEYEATDKFVVELARDEARFILADLETSFDSKDARIFQLLEERLFEISSRGHFVVVEVYDMANELVAEHIAHDGKDVEKWLDKNLHNQYLVGATSYKRFSLGENQFLMVFVPLYDERANQKGHFEGVYRIPNEVLQRMERQPLVSAGVVFAAVLATIFILYPIVISMHRNLKLLTLDLANANIGILETLGAAISKRDSDTSEHNYRVTLYAIRIAEEFGLKRAKMRGLIKGAFLHDVGKIGIHDSILLKPGKLNDEEFAIMKTHVDHGVEIVKEHAWLTDAVKVVVGHHEKVDGSGYPKGLKQEKIPLNARIFAIADVFDALMSERPYKKSFSFEKSIAIMQEGKGLHFDVDLLDIFCKIAASISGEILECDAPTLKKMLKQETLRYF